MPRYLWKALPNTPLSSAMPAPLSRLAYVVFIALLAGCRPGPSTSDAAEEVASGGVDPDRRPATTMGHEGSGWLLRETRIEEEHPEEMLDALGIEPGMVVADIGAGVGYHSLRIADRVSPGGRVLATDLQPEMLAGLEARRDAAGIANVETILATQESTGLPDGEVDLALMVDVYHEISEPEAFLDALADSLAPHARVALVEFRGEDPDVPILEDHKMTDDQVIYELGRAGYELVERYDDLPWQHVLIFSLAEQR